MIGMCAGLSMVGMRPFAYTISTFALYRPFEMVRNDICYQNLPVTIVGMGAGTIYSTLGGTHLTQEDISIARSIPNMNIIAPCDPNELEEAINYCSKKSKNPVYLRIGKVGEKNFTDKKSEKVCIIINNIPADQKIRVYEGGGGVKKKKNPLRGYIH